MTRAWKLLPVLALLLALSGCYLKSGDALYSLPEAPEEYYDLQQALNQVLATGAEYAAPVDGSNRQSTQSVDLDADGEKEVVAFFRAADGASLEVYIFDKRGESYTAAAVIEGTGSAIDSVEYAQLDDTPGLEIIVGWQVSESSLQYLGVYGLHDWHVAELMSASYSEYCTVDLNGSGRSEIFLIKFEAELSTGVAQLYVFDGVGMEKRTDAALSSGVESLKRIVTGYIEGHIPAVLVAGAYGEAGIVTDVFIMLNGDFVNICRTEGEGVSSATVRNYYVYATDVDDDELMELPQPRALPVWPKDSAETFYLIDWYGIQTDGTLLRQVTTFHNYASGWYLRIPDEDSEAITVYREPSRSGLWTYIFARWDEASQTAKPLFALHAFSGDDREAQVMERNLARLNEVSDVVYAAELFDGSITAEELRALFGAIHTDWNTGEM